MRLFSKASAGIWALGAAMLVCLAINLPNVAKDLPYYLEIDEEDWILPAMHMAHERTGNPKWFGHPGSTVLYPLTVVARWNAVHPPLGKLQIAELSTTNFVFYGRLISLLYAILSVPLLFAIALRFGTAVAVGTLAATAAYPLLIERSTYIRSDTAGVFFCLLGILLLLRSIERPSTVRILLAGIGIGLAISTRYFLVALLPLGWFAMLVPTDHPRLQVRYRLIACATLLFGALIGFASSSPYVLLDWSHALADIIHEGRSQHLGLDGLGPTKNLLWHWLLVLPQQLGGLQWLLGMIGIALGWYRKHRLAILMGNFIIVFLLLISSHPLHAAYWTLPLYPLWGLLATWTAWQACEWTRQNCRLSRHCATALFCIIIGAMCLPSWTSANEAAQKLRAPSTRAIARQWMADHLPPTSTILTEFLALAGTQFHVSEVPILGELGIALPAPGTYFVTSGWREGLLRAEPERYAEIIGRYNALEHDAVLLQEWLPSNRMRGPIIRLYRYTGTNH